MPEGAAQSLGAIALGRLDQSAFGDPGGRQLGVEVADCHFGETQVGAENVQQVRLDLVVAAKVDARQTQALLKDLGGVRRQAARLGAADVQPVRHRHRKGQEAAVGQEDRAHDGDVAGMRAAVIGLVRDIDLARRQARTLLGNQVADLLGEGAGEERDPVALGDKGPVGVAETAGEVEDLVDHRAHRGARQHRAHLIDGRRQPCPRGCPR